GGDAPLLPDDAPAGLEPSVGRSAHAGAIADESARTPAQPLAEAAPRTAAPTLRVAIGRTARQLGADPLLAGGAARDPAPPTSIVDDRDAIELMLLGRVDFALCGIDLGEGDRGAGLCGTVLGAELFAVAVAEHSPLRALTGSQLRRLLRGAVADGAELGLPDG